MTRRDWLLAGSLGFLGVGHDHYLRLRAAQPATPPSIAPGAFGKAKRCILLLPYGSPPQHETFDPKPDAPKEVRGTHKPIPTNVPGVQIDEHLPRIARIMDRLTVVRSMTHPYPVHCTAYVVSGIPDYSPALESRPRDPKLWPFVGSVVDYVEERRARRQALGADDTLPVPRNIALPWRMNKYGGPVASQVQTGPYAAFLGPAYDPVLTEFEGKASKEILKISPADGPKHKVRDPYAGIEPDCRFRLDGAQLRESMTLDRHHRRLGLLKQLDDARRRLDRNQDTLTFDRYQKLALSLISSSRIHEALDVRREAMHVRESYGMTLFGQSCLAARRLAQSGSRFVTVFWDEFAYLNTDWDTHWNHFDRLQSRLLPGFDVAFSGLITDLEQRGLLDETLVVWMSEHGRTPKLNNKKYAGRDHWSRVYSIAMAGGGIGRGQVIGKSDRLGGDVSEHPVSPKDILASIFHLLGIDSHMTIPDQLGRPMPIAGTGVVRPELFG